MRNVLSIRGGGIRGIIPCCCLVKLESQLGGLTREHIDYCAGTSTGALLTAAVAAGIPASQLLTIYTERSKEIFTPTGIAADGKRIIRGFMYDPKNLYDVLVSVFGAAASWTLNDCPIGVMISATAMDGHNWFFVKDNPKNDQTTGGVKLVDAAVASACAPTYFDHWPIAGIQGQTQTLNFFDGGAGGTANPAYQACVEAFEYDNFAPADTKVTALGTGFFPAPNDPPKGLVGTIGWVTSTLVDSSEDWVDAAVDRQWPGIMQAFNPKLPSDIDEADLSAIPTLVEIGQKVAADMDWKQILG
jgi:patatin-like phospholipase/acyl hydrolase